MKKILTLAVLLWAFWIEGSNAADNQVTLTTGSGVTMRTVDIGAGVQSSMVILGSSAGAAIYGTAGTANANVLTIQGIASGTVVPVSLTSTTITGTVAATQSGAWSLSANQSVNISQINAVTPLMGNGVTGTGSQRVTIASDNTAFTVNAAQSGTWTVQPGNTPNTTSWLVKTNDGTNTQILDPCQSATKLYQTISQTTNTQLFAGTSAKKTYVCHIMVVGADAENISLVSGTGSVCATNTVAMVGSTTAANGPNLSANGGFSIGQGGFSVAASTVNADNVCLFQSGSGRVAGVMTYVAQ